MGIIYSVKYRILSFMIICLLLLTCPGLAAASQDGAQIEPGLLEMAAARGELGFWVFLRSAADTGAIPGVQLSRAERGQWVVAALQATAQVSQAPLLKGLAAGGYPARPYWIINAIHVQGPADLIAQLALHPEVARLAAEKSYHLIAPQAGQAPQAPSDFVNWGLEKTRAPQVWAEYYTRGEGIVLASIDTGVQYDHPALVRQYRGSLPGGVVDHNYSWKNFIDDGQCTAGVPCDRGGHGTHVTGIMVGETADLAYQIGMAPGARWIAVRACTYSSCSDQNLLAAAQWMLAPTDLNGENPRPELRPDIINNSWGGNEANPDQFFRAVVQAWNAAGILSTFAAGNDPTPLPACGEVLFPAYYPESLAVGGTDINDDYYAAGGYHTAFGPGPDLYGAETKPEMTAPAEGIRSSYPTGTYTTLSGTSMAAPHVAGAAALLWSSAYQYRGNIPATLQLLGMSAVDLEDTHCGGTATRNNVFGEGRLDIYTAVNLAHLPGRAWFPLILGN